MWRLSLDPLACFFSFFFLFGFHCWQIVRCRCDDAIQLLFSLADIYIYHLVDHLQNAMNAFFLSFFLFTKLTFAKP